MVEFWTAAIRAAAPCRWVLTAVADVASALAYLHANGVAHGDVYAHNMLAAPNGSTVLCDYGAAFFYPPEQRPLWEPVEVPFPLPQCNPCPLPQCNPCLWITLN